jgi:hypothetical protein
MINVTKKKFACRILNGNGQLETHAVTIYAKGTLSEGKAQEAICQLYDCTPSDIREMKETELEITKEWLDDHIKDEKDAHAEYLEYAQLDSVFEKMAEDEKRHEGNLKRLKKRMFPNG